MVVRSSSPPPPSLGLPRILFPPLLLIFLTTYDLKGDLSSCHYSFRTFLFFLFFFLKSGNLKTTCVSLTSGGS